MKDYAEIFDFLAKKLKFDDYIYVSTLILENCMSSDQQKKMLTYITKASQNVTIEVGRFILEKKQPKIKTKIVKRGLRNFTVIEGGYKV